MGGVTVIKRTRRSAYAKSTWHKKSAANQLIHMCFLAYRSFVYLRKKRQANKYLSVRHLAQGVCPLCDFELQGDLLADSYQMMTRFSEYSLWVSRCLSMKRVRAKPVCAFQRRSVKNDRLCPVIAEGVE